VLFRQNEDVACYIQQELQIFVKSTKYGKVPATMCHTKNKGTPLSFFTSPPLILCLQLRAYARGGWGLGYRLHPESITTFCRPFVHYACLRLLVFDKTLAQPHFTVVNCS